MKLWYRFIAWRSLRRLQREGLVEVRDGQWRLTPEGNRVVKSDQVFRAIVRGVPLATKSDVR